MLNITNLPEPLTEDEKRHLFANWDRNSWKVLSERNMKLALKTANSFENTRISDEDLFSIALVGLVKAAQKFNPERGTSFSTFAIKVMRNEIFLELRKIKKSVYESASLNDLVTIGNGECELGELLQDRKNDLDDHAFTEELLQKINLTLNMEKDRNRRIIICFLNGIKQCENARINGTSQANVSRIIKKFKNGVMKER